MALTTLTCPLRVGHCYAGNGLVTGIRSNPRLDSSPTKAAWIVQAPESGDIERISFYIATVTSSQDIVVAIQTLDSSGDPSGTAITNGTAGAVTPSAGAWNHWTFSTDPTVVAGQFYAIVIEWSGTAGDVTFNSISSGVARSHPYLIGLVGANWTALDGLAFPMMGIRYSGGTYPFMGETASPFTPNSGVNYGNSDTVKEVGIRFRLNYSARLAGIYGGFDFDGEANLGGFEFYTDAQAPGAGTRIITIGDQGAGEDEMFASTAGARAFFLFDSPQTLAADTYYKLTHNPTDGGQFWTHELVEAAAREAIGALDFSRVQTTDDSTWSESTTTLPQWGLILDQIDFGTSGGASSYGFFG